MAFTFLKAQGESVGSSLVEQDKIEVAEEVIAMMLADARHLVEADIYSDAEGIPLHPDHEYELEVVYDNPTTEPIDAMGAIRGLASTAIE